MTDRECQAALFQAERGSSDAVVINDRCLLRTEGELRVVVVAGVVVSHFQADDRMAAAHAMVTLVEQGIADQNDVARAFGCSARTVRRYQHRYEEGGMVRLGRGPGYPQGKPRQPSRDRLIGKLKANGVSNRAIALRLGIDEKAVRKRLQRLGWKRVVPEQAGLPFPGRGADPNPAASRAAVTERNAAGPSGADPNLSASWGDEAFPVSFDDDPADRRWDRLFAYLGLLDDAAPLFRSGTGVPGAGVLLAVPGLLSSGVFAAAHEVYGSIGPAFYGLRTTVLTLALMALLRIGRPEALKEHSPPDLGRVLGLDRAPEVKTLRRKLTRLAHLGGADRLGRLLAQRRVASRGETLGFLYVDGHVRVYHGRRDIPHAYVARMRLSERATTDYWVNDERGDPLFVVTAEANAGLVAMLPGLLDEVRKLVGERRVTIVFDRGGYSPKLFDQLIRQGFDILTYRKGRVPRVPAHRFREHVGTFDGRMVRYLLADQGIALLNGRLRLRQVTRLTDGHQTPVLTSRRDLAAIEVAHRMFERWRQENFFKYMREEFLLDALVDYQVEPDDPQRDVPNPAWAAVDAKVRQARAEIADLQRRVGAAAIANREAIRPTMRGFKIAHGKMGRAIRAAARRLQDLERKRSKVPRRIPVAERAQGEVVKLSTERKHLTSILKMVAYQTESDLFRALASHYRRNEDEGRTLVQTALAGAADLQVAGHELRVTLAPLSSPHRSRAIAALCRGLDAARATFPGTRLRLRFAVASHT